MPACSFIIPVLNEAGQVAGQLRHLRRQYPDAELVVVDGGSRDATVARARPLCDQLLETLPGRARQMNLGGRAAGGDYLFFLHADSMPGVSAARLQTLLRGAPSWGFCRVRLSGVRWSFRVIESGMNLRSRLTRVATGDQMLFLARELFQRTGGFAPIPLMEDVEYCKRLRRCAAPLIIEDPVLTSSRRWENGGVASTVLRMWALRLAWFAGVSPRRLHRHYYPDAP